MPEIFTQGEISVNSPLKPDQLTRVFYEYQVLQNAPRQIYTLQLNNQRKVLGNQIWRRQVGGT